MIIFILKRTMIAGICTLSEHLSSRVIYIKVARSPKVRKTSIMQGRFGIYVRVSTGHI